MKKILLILAMLALAAPTMAAVSVSVVDNSDCTGDITYDMTGEPNLVRAWALRVEVDGGAVITAVSPAVAGESDAVNKGFGFFPGTIVIVGDEITDPNTPVAPNDLLGATGTGIGTDTVVLEMGSLHVDANFPPDTGILATITVSQACNVTITAEVEYRGGIVREDASQVIGATLATNAPITCEVVSDCLNDTDAAKYAKWVDFNRPDCWCFRKQCHGDADNLATFGKPVMLSDLAIFKGGFNLDTTALKAVVVNGMPGICADFDYLSTFGKAVMLSDLTIFKTYFNLSGGSVPECPTDTINFWLPE